MITSSHKSLVSAGLALSIIQGANAQSQNQDTTNQIKLAPSFSDLSRQFSPSSHVYVISDGTLSNKDEKKLDRVSQMLAGGNQYFILARKFPSLNTNDPFSDFRNGLIDFTSNIQNQTGGQGYVVAVANIADTKTWKVFAQPSAWQKDNQFSNGFWSDLTKSKLTPSLRSLNFQQIAADVTDAVAAQSSEHANPTQGRTQNQSTSSSTLHTEPPAQPGSFPWAGLGIGALALGGIGGAAFIGVKAKQKNDLRNKATKAFAKLTTDLGDALNSFLELNESLDALQKQNATSPFTGKTKEHFDAITQIRSENAETYSALYEAKDAANTLIQNEPDKALEKIKLASSLLSKPNSRNDFHDQIEELTSKVAQIEQAHSSINALETTLIPDALKELISTEDTAKLKSNLVSKRLNQQTNALPQNASADPMGMQDGLSNIAATIKGYSEFFKGYSGLLKLHTKLNTAYETSLTTLAAHSNDPYEGYKNDPKVLLKSALDTYELLGSYITNATAEELGTLGDLAVLKEKLEESSSNLSAAKAAIDVAEKLHSEIPDRTKKVAERLAEETSFLEAATARVNALKQIYTTDSLKIFNAQTDKERTDDTIANDPKEISLSFEKAKKYAGEAADLFAVGKVFLAAVALTKAEKAIAFADNRLIDIETVEKYLSTLEQQIQNKLDTVASLEEALQNALQDASVSSSTIRSIEQQIPTSQTENESETKTETEIQQKAALHDPKSELQTLSKSIAALNTLTSAVEQDRKAYRTLTTRVSRLSGIIEAEIESIDRSDKTLGYSLGDERARFVLLQEQVLQIDAMTGQGHEDWQDLLGQLQQIEYNTDGVTSQIREEIEAYNNANASLSNLLSEIERLREAGAERETIREYENLYQNGLGQIANGDFDGANYNISAAYDNCSGEADSLIAAAQEAEEAARQAYAESRQASQEDFESDDVTVQETEEEVDTSGSESDEVEVDDSDE